MKAYAFYTGIFFIMIVLFLACGSGDYTIDPDEGIQSQVGATGGSGGGTTGGTTSGGSSPQQYFTDNLWPLMKLTNGTGCASSGCHGNTAAAPQTFYKIDANSASNSWNWASVRRKNVDTSTGYAGNSSVTLKARKDGAHNTFQNWSASQKSLLDTWTNLP